MLKIEIYQDGSDEWRWRAFEANHRVIADSAEGYVTFAGAERAVENLMTEFRADVAVVTRERRKDTLSTSERRVKRGKGEPEWTTVADYAAEGAKS